MLKHFGCFGHFLAIFENVHLVTLKLSQCPMSSYVHPGGGKCLDVSVIIKTIPNVADEGISLKTAWMSAKATT